MMHTVRVHGATAGRGMYSRDAPLVVRIHVYMVQLQQTEEYGGNDD